MNHLNYTQELHKMLTELKAEYPQLSSRIERAGQIVASGGVSDFYGAYSVASQSEPGVKYAVYFNGEWRCCCNDHLGKGYHPAPVVAFGGGVQACCKHIIASLIVWTAGSKSQALVGYSVELPGQPKEQRAVLETEIQL